MSNGLSLYAVWVRSNGSLQGWNGCNSLTAATYNGNATDQTDWSIDANLSSITALTDSRDGNTYAIARLSDGNCWMIENLRTSNSHQEGGNTVSTTLTTSNTNNPLNDNNPTNPTVTLKHNYADTDTYNTLSATSSVAYDATTAPEGWCSVFSASCIDQSRLRTDNTANRTSNPITSVNNNIYTYGNYYNWYSATAGNGTFSTYTSVVDGDLCPYGWNLPTATYSNGGLRLLTASLGSNDRNYMNSSTMPTGEIMSERLRHFPNNFIYSGYVTTSSINQRGSAGAYWTSEGGGSSDRARIMYFLDDSVYPGRDNNYGTRNKFHGASIRCMKQI